jgi:hypothetical protein
MPAPKLKRRHHNGSNEYFDRAETGIKTIAAVHSQCRSWVKSRQTIAGPKPTDVRYCPKADNLLRCSDCPLCAIGAVALLAA